MSRKDDELQEEIESHLRMAMEERMARGESQADAERAVRREFGNVTHIREVTREFRNGAWLEQLWLDLLYGMRGLLRTPAFTMVAVLTLALAIGANSAVFTLVNSVLLRPLPFPNSNELYLASYRAVSPSFTPPLGLFDGLFLAFRNHTRSFGTVAAYQRAQITLTGAGDATRIAGVRVSPAFFGALGATPALGRTFSAEEETRGHERVVMLSDGLWRQRFGADRDIVGKVATIDGLPHTIIGVAQPRFSFPASTELWLPLVVTLDAGNSFIFSVIGRLRAGVTPAQAAAELEAIAKSMPRDPRDNSRSTAVAEILPLRDTVTGNIRKALLIFSGAVGFVLLIACANVANLLLIRASTRRREMAIRVALGASRIRIATQLLAESILIALIGGAAGVLIAFVGVRVLIAMAPPGQIPRLDEVSIDGWVLMCTMTVALFTGLIFGVVPALIGSRREPREALANGTRAVVGRQSALRRVLVSAEIALALILLTGAGLMVKSFARMQRVDTGYHAERVHTMVVDLPPLSYPTAERISNFHGAMREQLATLPGTVAIGAVSFRPMTGRGIMGDFAVDGGFSRPAGYVVGKPTVSPGYFDAMGIHIISGRDFTERDNLNAPGVVVVSESVARTIWPGQNAIGKRISMRNKPEAGDWLTVVGVVNDVMQDTELTRSSTVYLPYLQTTRLSFINHMTFVVRSDVTARNVETAMRKALRDVDATVPAQLVQSMDDVLMAAIAEPKFQTRLLTAFSLLALVLAIVGTYGVLAYDVAERAREISLRMALGATSGDVMRAVLRQTAVLALIGATIGVLGSLALSRVLSKSLFEVTPTDPSTMIGAVLLIVASALVAGFVPARRATRIDALAALSRG